MRKKILILLLILLLQSCASLNKNSSSTETQKKNNKIAEINLQLGTAYLEKGDMEKAKQKLLYAMEKAPKLPEVWYTMAYFQEKSGNTVQADSDYLKAISLAPNRGDVQNNYGTFLCRSGYYNEAIQHFMLAIQDPQYLEISAAYENAGLCALKIPDKKLASRYFNKALENDPNRAVSLAMLNQLRTVS